MARSLNIPLNRCQHWVQILCRLGLLEQTADGYAPSRLARFTRKLYEIHRPLAGQLAVRLEARR